MDEVPLVAMGVPADKQLPSALAPHLAQGLRGAVAIDHAVEDWTPAGPGVLVVGTDRTVRATTPAAAARLDELAWLDSPRTGELPTVVRAVVEQLALTQDASSSLVLVVASHP